LFAHFLGKVNTVPRGYLLPVLSGRQLSAKLEKECMHPDPMEYSRYISTKVLFTLSMQTQLAAHV